MSIVGLNELIILLFTSGFPGAILKIIRFIFIGL
jgi:hypothetical protein